MIYRQSDRQTVRQTDSQTDRQTDGQIDTQRASQPARQTDREPGRQADRQTGMHACVFLTACLSVLLLGQCCLFCLSCAIKPCPMREMYMYSDREMVNKRNGERMLYT